MTIAAASSQDIAARIALVTGFARHFEACVAATPAEIPAAGLLAGPMRRTPVADAGFQESWVYDNLHYPMNVGQLLRLGFTGIAAAARANAAGLDDDRRATLEAVARCHEAAARLAAAHADAASAQAAAARGDEARRLAAIADNCRALAAGPPASFAQAVQLFWLAYCLRHYAGSDAASTIGRLDQHLQPFYAADLAAGRITRDGAMAVLADLWRGFNAVVSHPVMGLMNLMLAGQTPDGRDATNDISYMMIDTTLALGQTNPFLSVRLHASTPAAFLDKVVELQLTGHGQGTVYNDEKIIPGLVRVGVPLESARNYANDGCNEVTIDGESEISMAAVEAVKCLELALFNGQENPGIPPVGTRNFGWESGYHYKTGMALGHESGDFLAMTTFEQFLEAFMDQYCFQVARAVGWMVEGAKDRAARGMASPFVGGTFPLCLQHGLDLARGGAPVAAHIIFLGSLGTVCDALAAVKKVVFDDRACTPAQLLDALRADWQGFEPLRQRCLAAPKFGNDDDYADAIAVEVVRRTTQFVKGLPSASGKPIWPCLFMHSFIANAQIAGATPDGRRHKDPIGEHFSPTPGRALHGPTAVIRSATKVPLDEAIGVAIFHVALTRGMVPRDDRGRRLLKSLIRSGLQLGITQMNLAIYDVAALRDAQLHPDRYSDLIVRVWGYSARFVSLSPEMQDHIIARAVGGQ